MSIRAMTWAFSLPLEPRAKIAVLAIADNARDDGVAWPSRSTIAEKSSQSRATVNRRLKIMSELGVLEIRERFREDGTQTTDEIRLNLALTPDEVMRRMQALQGDGGAEQADEMADENTSRQHDDDAGGGYQPDTLGSQSGDPGAAVVTGGGSHSGHPQDEPSLEPKESPPTPSGGVRAEDGPLRKVDKVAIERRDQLWQLMLGSYPGIASMDQHEGRLELDRLSIDDAEWAVSVAPLYGAECAKLRKPPRNVHLWLRKGMFRNFAKAAIKPPEPDGVWIVDGSEEDRALGFVRNLARVPHPFVRTRSDGSRGYQRKGEVGADVLSLLQHFGNQTTGGWRKLDRGSEHYAAWQRQVTKWVGSPLPFEPGTSQIRVPCMWPPSMTGKIYPDDETPPETDNGGEA